MAGWAILEPFVKESVVLWGEIEDIQLPAGDTQSRLLRIRGVSVAVDERITRVAGRGEHADVDEVADLRVGHPVRAQVTPEGGMDGTHGGSRIVVREIPPEHRGEPLPEFEETTAEQIISTYFGFAIVGAAVAGLIAAADGLVSRNLRRGVLSGLCGIGIAIAAGLVATWVANRIFTMTTLLAYMWDDEPWTSSTVTGWPLMILSVGRSLAWGVVGVTVGLGQGAAMRSGKLALNGLLGGMLGALLGGVFFEPLCKIFANTDLSGEAAISRAVGFGLIGLAAGLMIGLVEHLAKDAWLLMRAGPLTGKQFVLYMNPTAIGSSPKCGIYLFKDPDVEPRHALIHKQGGRHEIQDLKSPAGTYVNGQRVTRHVLRDGDQIVIGQTVLEYSERARGQG